ncbi:putative Beta-hexosaminidase subunit beta [Nannochloris sp. 'desiccata']|nr:putative Beta-hexosaminidase subunit beta [Chlorella desiccata (nom. nud.)]
MRPIYVSLILAFIVTAFSHNGHAHPSLLPQPTNISSTPRLLYFHPHHFEFCNDGKESTILKEAFERYTSRIMENSYPGEGFLTSNSNSATFHDHLSHHGFSKQDAIRSVSVFVVSSDQSLGLQTSETYTLRINAPTTIIHATDVYGALRAMESLAQLSFRVKIDKDDDCFLEEDNVDVNQLHTFKFVDKENYKRKRRPIDRLVLVNETSIWDTPRFRHRGLLIDTARHFLPVSIIKSQIDAMEMSKLNVLHWHIVDDQSFPYQSEQLPELSGAGAFSSDTIYSAEDIDEIVHYARARGVRVIPEFDMPGHAASWGKSHPELLTRCGASISGGGTGSGTIFSRNNFKKLYKATTDFWFEKVGNGAAIAVGPIDPTKESTFSLIWQLLREVSTRFPDVFIHLGGDEVNFDCWSENEEITAWMQEHQDLGNDVRALLPYFIKKVIGLAEAAGKEAMVWQEALDFSSRFSRSVNGDGCFGGGGDGKSSIPRGADLQLPASTVVHVWKWASYLTSVNNILNAMQQQQQKQQDLAGRHLTTHSRRLQLNSNSLSSDASLTNHSNGGKDDDYWLAELAKVTKTHRAVLSAPWYLNLAPAGDEHTWERYWNIEPLNFKASIEQKERVLGGQACVWGELVDETNALQKTWPLAAAVAERLWSDDSVRDIDAARERMEEFRCKLLRRGVPAAPIGPGYCL